MVSATRKVNEMTPDILLYLSFLPHPTVIKEASPAIDGKKSRNPQTNMEQKTEDPEKKGRRVAELNGVKSITRKQKSKDPGLKVSHSD